MVNKKDFGVNSLNYNYYTGEFIAPKVGCDWYTKDIDCNCVYRYGSTQSKALNYNNVILEIEFWLFVLLCFVDCQTFLFENAPNSTNVNMYKDGETYIPWHRDDESLFYLRKDKVEPISIISFTLGVKRIFEYQFKPDRIVGEFDNYNYNYNYYYEKGEIYLGHGDIAVMDGYFQNYYQHQVPRQKNVSNQFDKIRINSTYRWIRSHCNRTCKKVKRKY